MGKEPETIVCKVAAEDIGNFDHDPFYRFDCIRYNYNGGEGLPYHMTFHEISRIPTVENGQNIFRITFLCKNMLKEHVGKIIFPQYNMKVVP